MDILVSKISLLVLERTFEKTIENILGFSTIENSLSIGIGSYLYQYTRSKKLINFLPDLNISANYKKVIHLKKNIGNSTVFFAIDNIDLKVNTLDGKNKVHGTAIVAHQQQICNNDTNKVRQF